MTTEREPGLYEQDGTSAAVIEQQRAEVREALRSSRAHSVTVFSEQGDTLHSAIYTLPGDSRPFLSFVAVKAIRDLAAVMGGDHEGAAAIVLAAIERGLGE
jgi:hypothetical protein